LKIAPLLIFAFSVSGASAWAAACCGGGFAAPALIVGDNRAQVTGSIDASEVRADVLSDGVWRAREDRETRRTLRLATARLLSDRWQWGGSLPLVTREREGRSSSGLGDIDANLGYEYLTDWDYSPWKPKGIGFLQLTLPTGKSIYAADDDFQLSARGRGFWALGLGTFLVKSVGRWDTFVSLAARHGFSRPIRSSQFQGRLIPGWGVDASVGLGYNTANWRFGGSMDSLYSDGIEISGETPLHAASERVTSAVLSASYLFSDEWASTLSYSDQTWLGVPSNTALTRGVTLVLQRRWLR
jgi:hypothetical protein